MEDSSATVLNQGGPIPKNTKSTLLLVEGILIILLVLFSGFLAFQNQTLVKAPPILEPNPTKTEDDLWQKRDFGLFSYQYPKGWHVAELWSEDLVKNGALIAISPDPVSTAPRGGPLAKFEITVKNGFKNPDEEFKKEVEKLNKLYGGYEELKQETIVSDIGPVYYYSGKEKEGPFEGKTIQTYLLTFETKPKDFINQQIVQASLISGDEESTKMLREIVLSIKKN